MKLPPSIPSFAEDGYPWRCVAHKGFSVLELLIAIGIIAVLAVVIAPVSLQLRKRAEVVKCQQNLRSVGMVLRNAVAEQGNTAGFWYRGEVGMMWNTMLVVKGYVTREQLRDMSCPSIPYAAENGSVSGRHYGVFMGAEGSRIGQFTDENGLTGNAYILPVRNHRTPASALFLVDSATAAKAPSIRAFPGGAGLPSATAGGIHLRHQGRANLLFLDGHLEPSSQERLRELGVQQVLDGEFQLQSL